MTHFVLVAINVGLIVGFALLAAASQGLLGLRQGRQVVPTWLATGVITLMDELTSVFYAPAEAHRFIGTQAIFFIAFTSLLMRFLSSRMVEIAQILERNDLRGGGVYSFSYLVLGPAVSFVAVASIMVDYILTACISTVSAVINGTAFLPIGPRAPSTLLIFGDHLGGRRAQHSRHPRERARHVRHLRRRRLRVREPDRARHPAHGRRTARRIIVGSTPRRRRRRHASHSLAHAIQMITIGVASCVLAYSGIESVLQTAGLVEGWRDISRAYWFLALTVGIVTPVVSALALSAPIDFAAHEGDLMPHWASVAGRQRAVRRRRRPARQRDPDHGGEHRVRRVERAARARRASLPLRLADRDQSARLALPHPHRSTAPLYTRHHPAHARIAAHPRRDVRRSACWRASCINIGCLLIYRYFRGTKEIREYYTSRTATLLLEVILVACFIYLAAHKPYGTAMWAAVSRCCSAVGMPFSRRYGPERAEVRQSDYPMEMVLLAGRVRTGRCTSTSAVPASSRRPSTPSPARRSSPSSRRARRSPTSSAANHYPLPDAGRAASSAASPRSSS